MLARLNPSQAHKSIHEALEWCLEYSIGTEVFNFHKDSPRGIISSYVKPPALVVRPTRARRHGAVHRVS